jgi:GTPase SAR1 family protein
MQKIYPFKFLDSYQREDKDFFFGRNEEIESLYQMIFQTKILLIYGTSGTGKTSLIQCGLANKFHTYDWLALPVRRGSNLISSLDKVLCDASDDVFIYTEQKESFIKDLTVKIEAVYKASFKPVYLIFDQFEELYVLGTKAEQELFVEAIKEILSVEEPVKVILSIREEYLGNLFEFEKKVPQLLRKKLRVEPMSLDKVTHVLKGINNFKLSNVRFRTDELDPITQGIFDRIKGKKKTLFIELPYLQVFLDKLYFETTKDASHQAEALITTEVLNRIGDIGDVLRNFLEEQVKCISRNLSVNNKNVSTETIWKILSPFCSLEGTKEPVSKQELANRLPDMDKRLLDEVVDAFVNSRIVNCAENENLYELAHDSLALNIAAKRSDEDIAILEVQRLIESQVAVQDEGREFFTERQLLFIEPYLEKFNPNDEERNWIAESRANVQYKKGLEKKKQQEELVKTRKRLRTVYSLLSAALLALLIAGYFWLESNSEKEKAKKAEQLAMIQKDSAVLAKEVADKALKKVNEQIAIISKKDFDNLKKRTEPITDAGGCPNEILEQMDSIAATHPDSLIMKYDIQSIREKCPQ